MVQFVEDGSVSQEVGDNVDVDVLRFTLNLDHRQNYFTLYLGTISLLLFFVVFFIALVRKRNYPVVIQLAKPESDAKVHEYVLLVNTSSLPGSGLTHGGRVAVQLVGTYADSLSFAIFQQTMKQNVLQRACSHIFVVYSHMDLGNIRSVTFTLYNFSLSDSVSWRPCFVEVMKSTTRERWAANTNQTLTADNISVISFPLAKGAREDFSFVKLVMMHHQWTSAFFNPVRFGAFSSFTNILFFFFTQSTLLLTTLGAFILAYQFLGKLVSKDLYRFMFEDELPFTQLSAAVVSTMLHQFELMLRNIRPSPLRQPVRHWRGLWRNDYLSDLMRCNINYDWNRHPSQYSNLANRFSSKTSLSSLDSSHASSASSIESLPERDDTYLKSEARKADREQCFQILRHCILLCKAAYRQKTLTTEQSLAEPSVFSSHTNIHHAPLLCDRYAVMGCSVSALLTSPLQMLPPGRCQFCLWVKHLNIRGSDLKEYTISLTHNIRRSVHAIRGLRNPKLAIVVMQLCLHQWVASLCCRMLKEAVIRMNSEKVDTAGLETVLQILQREESIIWFDEEGHKMGPMPGKDRNCKTHMVSNLYFTVMRSLVAAWKSSHWAPSGILRRPDEELYPQQLTDKKELQWNVNVEVKNIATPSDTQRHERVQSAALKPEAVMSMKSTKNTQPADRKAMNVSSNNPSTSCLLIQEERDKQPSGVQRNLTRGVRDNKGCPVLSVSPMERPQKHVSTEDRDCIIDLEQVMLSSGATKNKRINANTQDIEHPACTREIDVEGACSRSESLQVEMSNLPNSDVRVRCKSIGSYMPNGNANNSSTDFIGDPGKGDQNNSANSKRQGQMEESIAVEKEFVSALKMQVEHLQTERGNPIASVCQDIETYANPVQFEVVNAFYSNLCYCCQTHVCQAYAVMYSILKDFAFRVIFRIVASAIKRRNSEWKDVESADQIVKVVSLSLVDFLLSWSRQQQQRCGKPLSSEFIQNLQKEKGVLSKNVSMQAESMGSIDSLVAGSDFSGNNPVSSHSPDHTQNNQSSRTAINTNGMSGKDTPSTETGRYSMEGKTAYISRLSKTQSSACQIRQTKSSIFRRQVDKVGFHFGRRKSHHGKIADWTNTPYPFAPTVMSDLRLKWPDADHPVSENDIRLKVDAGSRESVNIGSLVDPTHITPIKGMTTTATETRKANLSVDMKRGYPGSVERKQSGKERIYDARYLVDHVIQQSRQELLVEVQWLLGLKVSLASVIAFARYDIYKEIQDPIKIAVRNFTQALIVLLLEALLPTSDEENFVVTADDIRQRRKRVSSDRKVGRFDLTMQNKPAYDMNFLDFVVVKLCERWEMANVDLQHNPTMQFLSRCLAMANLDREQMERLEDAYIENPRGNHWMVLKNLSQVFEAQHSVAIAINEIMAKTLVYIVPETLSAILQVQGWLRSEEERVMYVCEKVCVLEHQARHRLSRRVASAASLQMQQQLIRNVSYKDRTSRMQNRMMNQLRQLITAEDSYMRLSKEGLHSVKTDLRTIRRELNSVQRIEAYQSASVVSKHARRTRTLRHQKVHNTICTMTNVTSKDTEYSAHQIAEVEWVVTRQMEKPLSSVFMNILMTIMFLGTLVNLLLVTILGASLSPRCVGQWFGLHTLAIMMIVFVTEPFKCIWYMTFNWHQPKPPSDTMSEKESEEVGGSVKEASGTTAGERSGESTDYSTKGNTSASDTSPSSTGS